MAESRDIMIVRHPQTEQNARGYYIGRGDSPLTDLGRQQVRWLSEVVAFWEPEIVLSSPLGRALDAARAVAPDGVELREVDDLQEIHFGQAEGHTYEELQRMGIRLDYRSGGPIAPGGESGRDFAERIGRVAGTIEACGCRALVVTHGGIMRHLLTHWLELPELSAWRFDVPNASVAVVRLCDGSGVLEELSPPPSEHRRPARRCKPWHL